VPEREFGAARAIASIQQLRGSELAQSSPGMGLSAQHHQHAAQFELQLP